MNIFLVNCMAKPLRERLWCNTTMRTMSSHSKLIVEINVLILSTRSKSKICINFHLIVNVNKFIIFCLRYVTHPYHGGFNDHIPIHFTKICDICIPI